MSGEIDDPDALVAAADRAMQARDPRGAIAFLERHLALRPTSREYVRLAAARRATGDLVGALKAADSALRIDAGDLVALLLRGSLLQAFGRAGEATATYQRALDVGAGEAVRAPALQRELERAHRHVEEDRRWRRSLEADSVAALIASASAEERRRIERFRTNVTGETRPFPQQPSEFAFPGLPLIEFFDPAVVPGIAALETEWETIAAEFRRLVEIHAAELIPLIAHAGGDHGVALASDVAAGRWSAIQLYLNGERVDAHADLCPRTMALFEALAPPRIPGRSPNLMFSLLDPGTRIPPHCGFANTRVVLHLPLIVPPDCGFRVGGEVRQWEPGRALLFDDTIEHEAWNDSDQLRVVLIGDLWRPELSEVERAVAARLMTRNAA